MMRWKWKAGLPLAVLFVLALLAGAVPARNQGPADYPRLDRQFEPLRTRFNADAGKVRLLLLLDPT